MIKSRLFIAVIPLMVLALTAAACAKAPTASQEGSQQVAEEFVKMEATFRFDGIPETLKLTSTMSVADDREFTFEFDSRSAGYGNRTGQILAQVITHHRAVITVKAGRVESAVMDDAWDMILQQEIAQPPPPPAGVPAAPNDSIVTAKVIDVIKVSGSFPWEIVIEIKSSEDVPGYANFTKQRIGEMISVKTQEDMSPLEKGQTITANVRLEGDERSRFYYATNIK